MVSNSGIAILTKCLTWLQLDTDNHRTLLTDYQFFQQFLIDSEKTNISIILIIIILSILSIDADMK